MAYYLDDEIIEAMTLMTGRMLAHKIANKAKKKQDSGATFYETTIKSNGYAVNLMFDELRRILPNGYSMGMSMNNYETRVFVEW